MLGDRQVKVEEKEEGCISFSITEDSFEMTDRMRL